MYFLVPPLLLYGCDLLLRLTQRDQTSRIVAVKVCSWRRQGSKP